VAAGVAAARERFDIRVISLANRAGGADASRVGHRGAGCGARSVRDLGALWRLWRALISRPPTSCTRCFFTPYIASRLAGPAAGIAPRRILNEIQTVEIERPWHLLVDGLTCRLCRLEVGQFGLGGRAPASPRRHSALAAVPGAGAVDVQAIASAPPLDRASLGLEPDERLALWTGRLDPVKGFEEMLEAASKLKSKHRFKLLLAGDGPYRPRWSG